MFSVNNLLGQETQVKGAVFNPEGETLPGVSVTIEGTKTVVVTNMDGNYSITVPEKGQVTLVFSYIGYKPVKVAVKNLTRIDVTLENDVTDLDEVVLIGYSSVKKRDLTGAITVVAEKDFQKGVVSADRMIMGKIAGVVVTPNGGAPGSGSRIRIRGGASLSGSNDPLIIIDGVPIENSSVEGAPGLLSTINPNDIESMNVMKDASATAIYGSRASNGIVIITTKQAKFGQKTKVDFNTRFSTSVLPTKIEVLSAGQIRSIINNYPLSNNEFKAMLGTSNTDWQDQIYQPAFGTDNNLTISGTTTNMPYRLAVGYLNEAGLLKSGNMERLTTNVNLNPRYLNGHLKIDISLKGSIINNKIANTGAIEGAMGFDPTQPVTAPEFEKYGGYYTWLLNDGSVNSQAFTNPVALLDTYSNTAKVMRGIASAQVDYRMHFLPELRVNLNLSYDYAQGFGNVKIPKWASYAMTRGGQNTNYGDYKTNKLFESYLN
jgi:iron complex outermembrane receptor protein